MIKSNKTTVVKWLSGLSVLLTLTAACYVYIVLQRSLPILEGSLHNTSIQHPVSITRDAQGHATISSGNRNDASYGLGFIHAQERFFQMDLSRRLSAGELSVLFGSKALDTDIKNRLFQFRKKSKAVVSTLSKKHQNILQMYTAGVNDGLKALAAPPFEYTLLDANVEAWTQEDTVLCIYALYITLQQANTQFADFELGREILKKELPAEIYAFITHRITPWDTPINGENLPLPTIPENRQSTRYLASLTTSQPSDTHFNPPELGSNNWAIAGNSTATGGATLASDMHLGIGVPNIWYRATIKYDSHLLVGVTLAGAPAFIAGSNSNVAWGFTYNYGDWLDLIELEADQQGGYLTLHGSNKYVEVTETIQIKDERPHQLIIKKTQFGPVISIDGKAYAIKWAALEPHAANLNILSLENVMNVKEAMALARTIGIPSQNFVAADANGAIGWSIANLIPNRPDYNGPTPYTSTDNKLHWDNYLNNDQHPVHIQTDGNIVTANARVASGDLLTHMGEGYHAIGVRQHRIKQQLNNKRVLTELDSFAIQLDDINVLLESWRDWAMANRQNMTPQFIDAIIDWDGIANGSMGYHAINNFRELVDQTVFQHLTQKIIKNTPDFNYKAAIGRTRESALWQLINTQPPTFLPAGYKTWGELFTQLSTQSIASTSTTKNKEHTFKHPLSAFVPLLGYLTDTNPVMLTGDVNTPKVSGAGFGAVQRMVVTPGHEEQGILHMPTSQSGHPLSPYYNTAHDAWAKGLPTPLLGGKTQYTLRLEPALSASR